MSAATWDAAQNRGGDRSRAEETIAAVIIDAELVHRSTPHQLAEAFPGAQVVLSAPSHTDLETALGFWKERPEWPLVLRRPHSGLELRALFEAAVGRQNVRASVGDGILSTSNSRMPLASELPDTLYQCSSDGTVRSVSPAFTERTGLSVRRFVEGYREAFSSVAPVALGAVATRRLSLSRQDGSPVELELTEVVAGRSWGGGVLGLARDLSQRALDDKERRTSQKLEALRRLAGGLTHDFNELLTVIRGEADLLIEGPGRESALAIVEAVDRASELMHRLFHFGHRASPGAQKVDLSQMTRDRLRLFGRMLPETIGVEVDLAATRSVWATPTELNTVLLALLTNAVEAMPEGGALRVRTADVPNHDPTLQGTKGSGGAVALSIEDTGEGMSSAVCDRLFEPFFTTRHGRLGRGLGLSEVYGIVQNMGGHLRVQSKQGEGTRAEVLLPCAGCNRDGRARATQEPPALILLVEDEDQVRVSTTRVLERAGFRVLSIGMPQEALGIEQGLLEQVSLLVSDVIMPQLSGPELYAQLKERRADLRAIFVTGYAAEFLDGELGSGTGFLRKPWKRNELLQAIRECLDAEVH